LYFPCRIKKERKKGVHHGKNEHDNKEAHAEMEVGMDTNLDQKKITLKRLNILRRYVYSFVHAKAMPRREEVLHHIDQAYVLEYAIADKVGVVHKVLQEWEL
jgi:hypothetical protein